MIARKIENNFVPPEPVSTEISVFDEIENLDDVNLRKKLHKYKADVFHWLIEIFFVYKITYSKTPQKISVPPLLTTATRKRFKEKLRKYSSTSLEYSSEVLILI